MSRPFHVTDDGADAATALRAQRRRLEEDGWAVVDGLDARPPLARAVLAGEVATPRDATSALLAALDGYGLLLLLTADTDTRERLIDDLRRVGPVEHREAALTAAPGPEELSEDGRAILALLAEGYTLGEAAARLALSRRTADRRLSEARQALGVTRTTEAIAIAARRGLLRPR